MWCTSVDLLDAQLSLRPTLGRMAQVDVEIAMIDDEEENNLNLNL